MKKKLRSRRGSTLMEVLCAFLLIALSTSLFAAAVGAANHINVSANRHWTSLLNEISNVESRSIPGSAGKMQILNVGGDTALAEVKIKLYKGSSGGGLCYYIPE